MSETVSSRRLRGIFALFACATLLLSLRVGYWQTIGRGDLLEGATDQVRSDLVLAAQRGVIRDRSGALLATNLRGLPNDVFFKVGLLTIVGLATKNAILIIEYAKDLQGDGKEIIEAVLEAVHLRLRPILMTSFAFILGVMPLALSVGAGADARK